MEKPFFDDFTPKIHSTREKNSNAIENMAKM
jgi:hypothetical protein